MADTKISALTALTNAELASDDVLPIVDTGATATKKITVAQLFGDTANGVVYLNGSKVATSGSALTFDGTNFGIGTSSPSAKLDVVGSAYFQGASAGVAIGLLGGSVGTLNNGSSSGSIKVIGGGTYQGGAIDLAGGLAASNPGTVIFRTGTAIGEQPERARIDSSGNVGIGATAGKGKLSVKTASATAPATIASTTWDSTYSLFGTPDTTTGACLGVGVTTGGTTAGFGTQLLSLSPTADWLPINYHGNIHVFYGGTTERLRIDSSGNVGIGTSSPSASAILDAQSTTKGVRMPNMTTAQKNAIASPAAGLMVFDTTLSKLCVYTGAAWETVTSI